MRIGKFRKAPADRKRYVVDYKDWLNDNEEISDGVVAGSVPEDGFYVDGFLVDNSNREVIFYVSGGLSGVEYTVTITVDTTLQQTKEDWVTFVVT